jgi:hypothetical protein
MRYFAAMTKRLLSTIILSLSITSLAAAQESEGHGPGVGVEETLGGATGATFVWDASRWHVDVLFGLKHQSGPDATEFDIGGRFLYLVHKAEKADFGIGAGLTILHLSQPDPAPNETNLHIEALAQLRVWLAPNVALSAALGFVLVTADNFILASGPAAGQITGMGGDGAFGIGGDLFGNFGFTYFFK